MAYVEFQGNNKIECTAQEAERVRKALDLPKDERPDTIEIGGYKGKFSNVRGVFVHLDVPQTEKDKRFKEDLMAWDTERRQVRELSIPEKINLTRPMMRLVWEAMMNEEDMPWGEYAKIANKFFEEHPKRTYVDAKLWWDLFRGPGQVGLLSGSIMSSVIETINSDWSLAQYDGEPQGEKSEVKLPNKVKGWSRAGDVAQKRLDELEIDVDKIPF